MKAHIVEEFYVVEGDNGNKNIIVKPMCFADWAGMILSILCMFLTLICSKVQLKKMWIFRK